MGALSFDTLCGMVRLRMGNRPDLLDTGNEAGINYYQIFVNQAYKHICAADYLMGIKDRKVIIPELETISTTATVAATPYIGLPSAFSIMRHIFDTTNNFRLRWIPEAKYVTFTDRATATAYSHPTEWCRLGPSIYLHPTPDAAYNIQLFYRMMPNDMTGENTTAINSVWDEPIITLATYKAMMHLRELDQAQYIRNELVELLQAVIPPVHQEERDRRESVRPDEAYIMQWYY